MSRSPDDGLVPLDVARPKPDRTSARSAPARPASSKLIGAEAALAAACLIGATAVLCRAAILGYLYIPYSDAHLWISKVFEAQRSGDWLGYFWTPQSEQRIPLARLAEALDMLIARGRAPTFLFLAAVLWIVGVAATAALLIRSDLSIRAKIWVGAACGLLLSDSALAEDLAFPVFSVYLFVAGPALAGFALFPLSAERGLRSPAFWGSLLCCGLAGLGNTAGLAVWPALLAAAALQNRSGRQIWTIGAAALVCIAALEHGLGLPSYTVGARGGGVAHWVKMAIYFADFVALPWSRWVHPDALAVVAGLAVLTAALLSLAEVWRAQGPDLTTTQQAGAGLVLFGLAAAVMATVGRVDELPLPVVPTRYTPFAALLQLGALLSLAGRVEGRLRAGMAAPLGAVLVVCAALALSADLHVAGWLQRASAGIRADSRRFDQGDASRGPSLYPEPAFAAQVRRELRARGLPN